MERGGCDREDAGMRGQDTARKGKVESAELRRGGEVAERREQGQRYDRALRKMKVTKGGLRPISLHLPCVWGSAPLAGRQVMGK